MTHKFYSFGPFQLFPSEQLFLCDGEAVSLAPKAFELLVLLVESQGRLMERQKLMEAIWPDSFVEEINLTVNISLLRKSLGLMPDGNQYIATVPKRGYRFNAPVLERAGDRPLAGGMTKEPVLTPVPAMSAAAAVGSTLVFSAAPPEELRELAGAFLPSIPATSSATATPSSFSSQPSPIPAESEKGARRRALSLPALLSITFAIAIVAAGALWILRTKQPRPVASGAPIHSLAVLPFEFIGDNSRSYLGLGMTDALITRLSGQSRMTVRPIGAVRKYPGGSDPVTTGKDLQVDAVLAGTVQRLGGQTRVTVRLLQVHTGQTLWVASFDEASESAFALEDAISQRLTQALTLHMTEQEQHRLASPRTRSVAAYDLYTQGRFLLNNRTIESVHKSIDLFQQAIHSDPDYAAAYAGLADAYILAGSYGNSFLAPSVAAPKAEEAVTRALSLDESSPEVHTSLAYLRLTYEWDWSGAEQEFRRALELDPASVSAHHWYSHELMALGRVSESHEQSEQALALDPTDVLMNEHMAWHHLFARQYDAAITQARKAVEIDPNFVQAHRVLGLAYLSIGDFARALPEFQTGVRLSHDDPVALAYLARCYAASHRGTEARQIVAQLESASHERYISAEEIGAVHAALGDRSVALQWLKQAINERAGALIYLNVDPVFDRLRSDPAFQEIVSRVGLPLRPPQQRP